MFACVKLTMEFGVATCFSKKPKEESDALNGSSPGGARMLHLHRLWPYLHKNQLCVICLLEGRRTEWVGERGEREIIYVHMLFVLSES